MSESNKIISDIHPIILSRFSSKEFSSEKKVKKETVVALLEAARWAPSANNRQPWRFLVFDEDNPAVLENARSCLSKNNQLWANSAPVLILSIVEEKLDNGKMNSKALHDLGMANENLLLQAISLKMNCHPMGGFDKQKTIELFNIPEGYTPVVMIAIGYPEDDFAKTPEERNRKPLHEITFGYNWGYPFVD